MFGILRIGVAFFDGRPILEPYVPFPEGIAIALTNFFALLALDP